MTISISELLSETHYLQGQLSDTLFFQSDKKHINEIYDLLISCLLSHNHFYYIENKNIITDTEYDQLFDKLKKIENQYPELIRDDSPTQKIVGQYEIQKEFKKSDHSTAILSLQNTYNTEEIMDRYDSITNMLTKKIETIENVQHKENLQLIVQNLTLLIEPKYDGLAIVITYTNGVLTKAVTRGDGYTGDDVTENIKTIKNLPQFLSPLPDKGGLGGFASETIVRGEVLMPKSVRKRLNIEREENGEEAFANTRNAAAGSLKLLDTNEVAKRGLVCYIYDVLEGSEEILSHFPQYAPPPERGNGEANISSILSIISSPKTKEQLLKSDIDFDGLVIKVVNPQIRELLGSTNHHPRRAIAYKFPAQQIATQIEHIERQVGRTGILTPVAHVTPKELSGVTISRVSLHNRDFIKFKDIQIYDRVRLQRSGEVIPYIVSVITDRRDTTQQEVSDTILCPACGSHAVKIENTVGTKTQPEITTQFICPNKECPGILKEKLKHFVSKNCMNIASIGDSLIEILVSQGLVHSLSDLYSLTQPEKVFLLKRFPGLATKKIDTLIEELEKSKHNEFRRFLNALGIHGIGIKLAKEITSHLEKTELKGNQLSISKFVEIISSPDFLSSIHGIGEILIQELNSWQSDPNNITLLKEFEKYGLKPHYTISSATGNNKEETSICITGTFPLSRSELEFYIAHAGYIFSPTLTKTTNYLFVGENAGSKKDKIGPNTTIISDWTQICTMLDISVPLFEPKEEAIPGGAMQSLFG